MHRRIRSISFCLGFVGMTSVLAAVIGSQFWFVQFQIAPTKYVELTKGAVCYTKTDLRINDGTPPVSIYRINSKSSQGFSPQRGMTLLPQFDRLLGIGMIATVPLWPFTIPFAAMIAWGWWRRSVNAATRCESCGYSISGLRSDICPECGSAIPNPKGSTASHPKT